MFRPGKVPIRRNGEGVVKKVQRAGKKRGGKSVSVNTYLPLTRFLPESEKGTPPEIKQCPEPNCEKREREREGMGGEKRGWDLGGRREVGVGIGVSCEKCLMCQDRI